MKNPALWQINHCEKLPMWWISGEICLLSITKLIFTNISTTITFSTFQKAYSIERNQVLLIKILDLHLSLPYSCIISKKQFPIIHSFRDSRSVLSTFLQINITNPQFTFTLTNLPLFYNFCPCFFDNVNFSITFSKYFLIFINYFTTLLKILKSKSLSSHLNGWQENPIY